MNDPITMSKNARESLARGLNALQADPSVPPALVELAAPIAQAMGALHQIERTRQLLPHAEVALGHLRGALGRLQGEHASHPAVNSALEAVAASLGVVHALGRMASAPQAVPPQGAAQFAPPQAAPPQPAPAVRAPAPVAAAAPQPVPVAAPVAAKPTTQPIPQRAPAVAAREPSRPQPVAQVAPAPMVSRDPFAAPAAAATPGAPVPAGNLQVVTADLGAHSSTNFFKGLAGNDIVDHGGLFVSTYVLPKIGHPVRLKVSLPGGYEFEANAVVKWTREDGGTDVPPGFGVQFTQITPEARQLVYRYTRNREPIFYDDL